MPEETISTDVKSALDNLEHSCLKNHLSRLHDYSVIISVLDKDEDLNLREVERLLAICVRDLKGDMKYVGTVMRIIPTILSRIQNGIYDPLPELLPSALAVIHIIKTSALLSKVESLKKLCFDTLLSYPDDTLIMVAEEHEEIMELFNLYCHIRIPHQIRLQACSVLYKLLKILPPEKKKVFIEKGIAVWFSKIIPSIMSYITTNSNTDFEMSVELLEHLTDDLVKCDYDNHPQWRVILECICSAQKYPAIMKALLQSGSGLWHRLWIIFIRLLKHQVTQSLGAIGTPINSMLPVVEAAFKVDVANRCRAFECWNVLIDSFSTETNESNINKRIKLLIIPLKSNNAKVEETALAKFKCWWHLMRKFQTKIDKFLDIVLVSFLQFCFGRHNATDKSALIPGQISIAVKRLCVQGVVDIVGHVHCDGCTELPKLKGKMINTKHLVDNWNHWIFSLTSTIMITVNTDNNLTKQQITCLWKSFLITIGELPENNIRKDLFSEMLSILAHLVKEGKSNAKLADIVLNVFLLSLFNEDKIKELLKTKSDLNDPLYRIIMIILDPALNVAYQSYNLKDLVIQFRPVTDVILDPAYSSPTTVTAWVLKTMPSSDIALMLWTALLESVWVSKCEVCPQTLTSIMMWPLKSLNVFTDVKLSAMTWYTTYDVLQNKLKKTDIEKEVSKFLFSTKEVNYSTTYYKLCITLSVLKHKMNDENCTDYEKEIELLQNLTSNIESYESFEQLFPILIDRVSAIIVILMANVNEILTRYILLCIKKMLIVMTQACNQQPEASQILSLIVNILQPLDPLFKVETYSKLVSVIIDDLLVCSSFLLKQPSIKCVVLSLMKTLSTKIEETDIKSIDTIKTIIDEVEKEMTDVEPAQNSDKNNFTTPKPKEVKKTKKKELSIVNTVVDNGEEYVVVKSNWKFNPRKLTENQKEKLQRKREDIPALYQDLSQSQDEFKLVPWKTDSQDTSNSSKSESKSSKLEGNETATEMLRNLPSSNVVPKILESFFSENEKKDSSNNAKESISRDNIKKAEFTTPKNTKSPRMALKDRVFRNVRNLIEKSEVQQENKTTPEVLNKTEAIIKIPTQSKSNESANVVNSAPPLLSADRPSRVKRKPKKFDELLLLSAKRGRQSLQDSKSDDKLGQTAVTKTRSNADMTEDVQMNELDSALIVSVTENKEDTKRNDLKVHESVSIASIAIGTSNNVQDGKREIDNATDAIIEDKIITVESEEHQTLRLEMPAGADNEKDDVILNNKKNENFNGKKYEELDDKHIEKYKDKKAEKSKDKRDDNSKDQNKEKSDGKNNEITDVKKKDKSNDKKDEKSNDQKVVKSSNEPQGEKSLDKTHEYLCDTVKEVKEVSTPQQTKNKSNDDQKSTTKKNSVKKSRIEKELAIDMVEGHPFLKMHSQKRLTRKTLESVATGRRKSLADKLNKSKSELNNSVVKSDKRTKDKSRDSDGSNTSINADESQDRNSETKHKTSFSEDLPYSDDVIESSQDSTVTTISVKSTKKTPKKVAVVAIEKIKFDKGSDINQSQSILDCVVVNVPESPSAQESKDDIELPLNKTALQEKSQDDLTEDMGTEPIDDKELSEAVIEIKDVAPAPLTISSDESVVGPETQEIAEADTQPNDPKDFMDVDVTQKETVKCVISTKNNITENQNFKERIMDKAEPPVKDNPINEKSVNPSDNDNTTITLSDAACTDLEKEGGASSPSSFRDEEQRKQDFMNNTLEISPIKNMSPVRNKKSPSPETSSDYVVIKLSSPVQSNGEPYENCGSPEVFTEDKVSPDKRDQSPPRVEVSAVTNTSPSSSLSLKKNRPQVRSGGRAAQMLGLCVPDKLQAIINLEKNEIEEVKKTSASSSTPARRNLRILYNSASENSESTTESDDSENFLKFRRSLPAVDSSPSGPILKRKLIEISDDTTMSPASKRKRVSFHDPPVSTTVSVQKYIEPAGLRSPQNSANKRLERQLRQHMPLKSPKRLDSAFKLDTVLTKTIESFSDTQIIAIPDDSQPFSLDETPVVEIVRASELNDSDPICPDLIDCDDPIENIASELSSSAMKTLLVKELEGKVETVGDLAKMTELEVNRLCIKAPKVKVARKVLTDYASKRVEKAQCNITVTIDDAVVAFDENMLEPEQKAVDMEIQTDNHESSEMEVQTDATPTTLTFVQTETVPIVHTTVQTDDSGSKSTEDIIKSCLAERPDFVEEVGKHLEESSIQQIAEKLPFNAVTNVLMKRFTQSNSKSFLNKILEQCNQCPDESHRSKEELSFIRDYLCDRYNSQDLILFCSEVLKSVYDKPA